jgi:hypothetical protein
MKTPAYDSWHNMKQRCNNPNNKDYHYYGGRDIKICDRWDDFQNFLKDMGLRPIGLSIDRIDNDGNYEPGNCRWATRKEQGCNTRKQRLFIAMNLQGTMVASNNQREFARQHNFDHKNIRDCLRGKQKTCKGWRFSWL